MGCVARGPSKSPGLLWQYSANCGVPPHGRPIKINETRSRPTKSVASTEAVRVARAGSAGSGEAQGAASARPINDSVSTMGIPEAELTPKVRDALMSLMAEVQEMRRDFSKARERVATLERLADRDPLIPVANCRACSPELLSTSSAVTRRRWPLFRTLPSQPTSDP